MNCKETTDVIIAQLRREIELLAQNDVNMANAISERLLSQDGKIAEVCVYIKDSLSATIAELVSTMQYTGEIDTLITKAVSGVLASALVSEKADDVPNFEVKTVRDDDLGLSYIVTKVKKNFKPHVNFTNGTNENAYSNNKSTYNYMQTADKPMAINAGLRGVTVKEGISHIENNIDTYEGFYILCIDADGRLATVPRTTTATDIINMGYRDAINIWSPVLVDGTPFNPQVLDETHEDYDYIFVQKHPRQVLGVLPDGRYIVITVDGRMVDEGGADFEQLVLIAQKEGCVSAYNLDGGASTQTVIGKRLINRLISKTRAIGTVITFESEDIDYECLC